MYYYEDISELDMLREIGVYLKVVKDYVFVINSKTDMTLERIEEKNINDLIKYGYPIFKKVKKATIEDIEEYCMQNNHKRIICYKGTWYEYTDFREREIKYFMLSGDKYRI